MCGYVWHYSKRGTLWLVPSDGTPQQFTGVTTSLGRVVRSEDAGPSGTRYYLDIPEGVEAVVQVGTRLELLTGEQSQWDCRSGLRWKEVPERLCGFVRAVLFDEARRLDLAEKFWGLARLRAQQPRHTSVFGTNLRAVLNEMLDEGEVIAAEVGCTVAELRDWVSLADFDWG